LSFLAVIAYFFIYDRKREKSSVVETMGKDMWDEIASEREDALRRAEKFKEILKEVNKRSEQ
jgi:hypothetical protein